MNLHEELAMVSELRRKAEEELDLAHKAIPSDFPEEALSYASPDGQTYDPIPLHQRIAELVEDWEQRADAADNARDWAKRWKLAAKATRKKDTFGPTRDQ